MPDRNLFTRRHPNRTLNVEQWAIGFICGSIIAIGLLYALLGGF